MVAFSAFGHSPLHADGLGHQKFPTLLQGDGPAITPLHADGLGQQKFP
jgi:hypothetical protein